MPFHRMVREILEREKNKGIRERTNQTRQAREIKREETKKLHMSTRQENTPFATFAWAHARSQWGAVFLNFLFEVLAFNLNRETEAETEIETYDPRSFNVGVRGLLGVGAMEWKYGSARRERERERGSVSGREEKLGRGAGPQKNRALFSYFFRMRASTAGEAGRKHCATPSAAETSQLSL